MAPKPPLQEEFKLRIGSFKKKAITTAIMLSLFMFLITLGHVYCSILVLVITSIMYKEVISLRRKDEKDKRNSLVWIDWYYFSIFTYALLPYFFKESSGEKSTLSSIFLYEYHSMVFVPMFFFGILLFVFSLERGSYRYQFQRLGFSIITLILVFFCPASVFYNIQKGLFWFFLPQICVIANECIS